MIEPEHGQVVVTVDAPGKHARGLAFIGGTLWNADYQDDRIHAIAIEPGNLLVFSLEKGNHKATPHGASHNRP